MQGGTLVPFLLIVVADYVLCMFLDPNNDKSLELNPRRSSRNPETHLTDTDFTDGIALISGTLENSQCLIISLEMATNCIGLYINEYKTENMDCCQIKTKKLV